VVRCLLSKCHMPRHRSSQTRFGRQRQQTVVRGVVSHIVSSTPSSLVTSVSTQNPRPGDSSCSGPVARNQQTAEACSSTSSTSSTANLDGPTINTSPPRAGPITYPNLGARHPGHPGQDHGTRIKQDAGNLVPGGQLVTSGIGPEILSLNWPHPYQGHQDAPPHQDPPTRDGDPTSATTATDTAVDGFKLGLGFALGPGLRLDGRDRPGLDQGGLDSMTRAVALKAAASSATARSPSLVTEAEIGTGTTTAGTSVIPSTATIDTGTGMGINQRSKRRRRTETHALD
jgi:hypothetical protein